MSVEFVRPNTGNLRFHGRKGTHHDVTLPCLGVAYGVSLETEAVPCQPLRALHRRLGAFATMPGSEG